MVNRKLVIMSKFNNLNPEVAFKPFAAQLGDLMPKLTNDAKTMLGRLEKDLETKPGEWKATASFKLTSKEGHTLQLPPNNPLTILLCFGLRINELSKTGGMELVATIPKACTDWVAQESIALRLSKGKPVAA